MNIASTKKAVQLAMKALWPVLLIGQPGIGKSDLCEQVAAESGMNFVVELATTAEPTDLRGLPAVVKNKATYLPYGFLRMLIETTEPTLVLIDDLGHASVEVQKAYMHLLLARTVNEHKISDSIFFVAATNDVGQRSGVSGIIAPLQNRLYQIRVEPDTKEWTQWAVNKSVHPAVIGFVRSTPNLFSDWKPPVGLAATCTPRSTKMLADFYKIGVNEIEPLSGCVGQPIAMQFLAYTEVFKQLPSVHEIIKNPKVAAIPEGLDRKHGICAALACSDPQEETWQSILIYLKRLPIEFQVACITDGSSRHKSLLQLPAVRSWVKENRNMLL